MTGWFKEWFKHNPGLKLVSLLVAGLVWFWASSQIYTRRGPITVPVTLQLAEGMVVKRISPPHVEVILEVPKELGRIKEFDSREIKIVHDLHENREAGRVVFNLSAHDVRVPERIRVVSINPGRITAEVDRLVDRVLPVKAIYRGRPRAGYRVSSETIIPPEVRVPGPKSLLERLQFIKTRPIYINGRSNSFDTKTPLEPVGSYSPSPLEPVEVLVVINPELQGSKLEDISIAVLKDKRQTEHINISPDRVTLYLKGPKIIMDGLAAADAKAYVDLIGLAPGSYELPLQCKLPSGVVLERAKPETIKATLGRGSGGPREVPPPE